MEGFPIPLNVIIITFIESGPYIRLHLSAFLSAPSGSNSHFQ